MESLCAGVAALYNERNMRRLKVALIITAVLVAAGTLGAWAFLASWVPTNGKALLIEGLERQWPAVQVSIGSVQHRPLQGFLLDEVNVTDRATRQPLVTMPRLKLRVAWLPLLFQRVAFRADAPLERPCRTQLVASGQYALRTRQLRCRLMSTDTPLESLGAALRAYVPAQLASGTVRLNAMLNWQAGTPWQLRGQLAGTQLVWQEPPVRLGADVTLDGQLVAPHSPGSPPLLDLAITARRGTLEGVPKLPTVTEVEGLARLTPQQLEIKWLRARAFDALWQLEGVIEPLEAPAMELLINSDLELANVRQAIGLGEDWQLSGTGRLEAVCRGPLRPHVALDCLTRGEVRDASLASAAAAPLTDATGRFDYDLLARRIDLHELTVRLGGQPLAVHGSFAHTQPPRLDLAAAGAVDLQAASSWLPDSANRPLATGLIGVDLAIRGRWPNPALTGLVELRRVSVQVPGLAQPLENIQGTAEFAESRMELRDLTMRLAGKPLRLVGTAGQLDTVPVFDATLAFPDGALRCLGQWRPQRVAIDRCDLTLPASRLQLSGEVSRDPLGPSQLAVRGTLELIDMARVPLADFKTLDPATIRGPLDVALRYQGRLNDWRSAAIRGEVAAERLLVREVPLDGVRMDIAQSNRTLTAAIPQARLAEGMFWSRLTLDHERVGTRFAWQLDLTNMQLARLAQAIPYWRNRAISGTASVGVSLTGMAAQRASWRGEGWLNAKGDRLGDMPLLDKLILGLFGALGDRLGLEPLRKAEITDVSCRWQLAEERLSTQDLRLGGLAGTEPVALYARGSVGLDQTLDFVVEPELSEGTVLQSPTTSTLARTVLQAAKRFERLRRLVGRHRLTGTLKEPQYRFEFSVQEVFRQLAPSPVDLLEGLFESVQ